MAVTVTDAFAIDALADERCKAVHPQRHRPGYPCHTCERALQDAAPMSARLLRIVWAEVTEEIERLCVESERAVGNPEYAAVRVDRLREVVANGGLAPP